MGVKELLTIVVHADKNATTKSIEKTLKSVKHDNVVYPLQIVVVAEGENGKKLSGGRRKNVEVVESMDHVKIRGEYINVLNAGDIWEKGSIACVEDYFRLHEADLLEENISRTPDKVDVIWRYTSSEAATFQTTLSAIWIRNKYVEQINEIVAADHPIKKVELIAKLYMQVGKYLCVPTIHVKQVKDKLQPKAGWFKNEIAEMAENLREASIERYQENLPYTKFIVMNLIAACLKSPIYDKLKAEEQDAFRAFLEKNLQDMDDVIISRGGLNAALRMFVFEMKYGKKVWDDLQYRNNKVRLHNLLVFNIGNSKMIKKVQKQASKGMMNVTVMISNPMAPVCTYYVKDAAGAVYPLERAEGGDPSGDVTCMGKAILQTLSYSATIPADHADKLQFGYRFKTLYAAPIKE